MNNNTRTCDKCGKSFTECVETIMLKGNLDFEDLSELVYPPLYFCQAECFYAYVLNRAKMNDVNLS